MRRASQSAQPWWMLGIAFATLLVFLSGCGSDQLSVEEYEHNVAEILKPDEQSAQEDPFVFQGLVPSLAMSFEIMRCLDREENPCIVQPEFTELRRVSEQARFEVADYHGKLCQDEELHPPSDLQAFHESLCADLQAIMGALDTVHITSQQALNALRDPERSTAFLQRAAERILNARSDMIEALRSMRESGHLDPVFTDVGDQIPELQN